MSKKISELTDADTLTGAELAEVVQDGVNKKVTINGFSLLPTVGTGTATGDIVGELGGHILDISQDGIPSFRIDTTPGVAFTTLAAFDPTGDGNRGNSIFSANPTQATSAWYATFNGGEHEAEIEEFADASGSSIEYTADTHTFNGVLNLPTQSAPVSPNDGDIWREDNTNTGLKIRINGVTKTITVS
jgi:hypothetical protein